MSSRSLLARAAWEVDRRRQLAVALAREGAQVGLLDADVYGPSVPLMMGVRSQQPEAVSGPDGEPRMLPIEAHGIKMMSIGFFDR
jgi:ATP-binding protein involved in chromosome partitioning